MNTLITNKEQALTYTKEFGFTKSTENCANNQKNIKAIVTVSADLYQSSCISSARKAVRTSTKILRPLGRQANINSNQSIKYS